jgi:predicted nucleotidyltransferase
MLKNKTINLRIVKKVALTLKELNNEIIYIGGAIVSLYVTDEGAEQPRPTKDIDISVQISTYSQMDQLRIKLATKKIYPAPTETVMYRYSLDDILIDFIPYEETPLGPTNRWLKPGFSKALTVPIGDAKIKILPAS